MPRVIKLPLPVAPETGPVAADRAGDAFVIPAGFRGTWEVLETTTKRFVISEPPAAG